MIKPLALKLLRMYLSGKTVERLARETGIPAARIEIRLRAATAYLVARRRAA